MESAIESFPKQFAWKPELRNAGRIPLGVGRFLVAGLGGSHLAADILRQARPDLDIIVRRSYGVGPHTHAEGRLVIANSYSGNTEEVIESLEEALVGGFSAAVIAVGGRLLEMAHTQNLPFVQMPDTGIQPRSALGFNLRALAAVMGLDDILQATSALAETLDPVALREGGRGLAALLRGKVPLIYASNDNESIAYNWKIKFNETGKVPAFHNVFPELNHNEMTGFDGAGDSRALASPFHVLLLADATDHPRIQKRMEATKELYEACGIPITVVPLAGDTPYERIFNSLVLADWTAYELARLYGSEPELVPMVEDFKKRIAK